MFCNNYLYIVFFVSLYSPGNSPGRDVTRGTGSVVPEGREDLNTEENRDNAISTEVGEVCNCRTK